jgi:hypothetical protein
MENGLSPLVDALPGVVWTALPDGLIEFLNQRRCDNSTLRSFSDSPPRKSPPVIFAHC